MIASKLPPDDPLIPAVRISDPGLTAAWNVLHPRLPDVPSGIWTRDPVCWCPNDLSCAEDHCVVLLHVACVESRSIFCSFDQNRSDVAGPLSEYDLPEAS